jgi:phospholipid/cholesterol/gamma-HCH transport system substrate-binding protein
MARINLSHELKVGALITVGLAIALVTVLSVGERQGLLKQRYRLKAQFSDVGGLQTGAQVRVAGYQVGVVDEIDLVAVRDSTRIEVLLKVERGAQTWIRRGSVARISSLGLLGDKLVEISPSSKDSAMLKDGEQLGTITVMSPEEILTRAAEIADTLSSTARSLNVIMKKVEQGTGSLGKIIDDPRLYTNMDSLLLLTNQLMRKINSNKGTVGMLFNDPSLYKNLNAGLANVSAISDSLRRGQGTLGRMIREPDLYNSLDSTSQRLNVILSRIEKGEGTLGKLSKDEEMYQKLKSASTELDLLIKDIKKNPKKYLSISVF